MSKLIQAGDNPKYPKEVKKYWKYSTTEAPPEWLTDSAIIKEVKDWPILDTEEKSDGKIIIKSVNGILVELPNRSSWIIYDEGLGFLSMTDRQKELLYEEI